MARLNALNITLSGSTAKEQLAELFGHVIANVQKNTISDILKNRQLSGDFNAGTLEAKRIEMSASKEYGTARSAGKAEATKAKPVVISIDQKRELLKEWEAYDLQRYGVVNLMQQEADNMALSMIRELEYSFFDEAVTAGTQDSPTATLEWVEKIGKTIVKMEKTKNQFVNGVPRDLINVICDPEVYDTLRSFLDTRTRPNVDTTIEEFGKIHGVSYYSSIYIPDGIKYIVMVTESVALPVRTNQYDPFGTIPLSDATADGFFFYYGKKAVMPDLILYNGTKTVTP